MKILSNKELITVAGGTISGTVLQNISKLVTTIFDIGRALGSTIRRVESDSICPL